MAFHPVALWKTSDKFLVRHVLLSPEVPQQLGGGRSLGHSAGSRLYRPPSICCDGRILQTETGGTPAIPSYRTCQVPSKSVDTHQTSKPLQRLRCYRRHVSFFLAVRFYRPLSIEVASSSRWNRSGCVSVVRFSTHTLSSLSVDRRRPVASKRLCSPRPSYLFLVGST